MKKFFALSIVMLAFSAGAFAQVSTTATATATVLTPLTINKVTDLNFGSFAATTGGTLAIDALAALTASGVTIIDQTAKTVASFTVSGVQNHAILVTVPASVTLSDGAPTPNTMVVTLGNNAPIQLSNTDPGTATFQVYGSLAVAAGQAAGVYTNTSNLIVTVNYN